MFEGSLRWLLQLLPRRRAAGTRTAQGIHNSTDPALRACHLQSGNCRFSAGRRAGGVSNMGPVQLAVLIAATALWVPAMVVNGACCTFGQPSYSGQGFVISSYGFAFPTPTCSDGPCSGLGFNYLAEGLSVSESSNPASCCDTSSNPFNSFWYNPPANSGRLWWPINSTLNGGPYPGTSRTCDAAAAKWQCSIYGKQVGTCQDTDISTPGPQPYTNCSAGTVLDSQATSTNLTNENCCLATCQDTDLTTAGLQPYQCGPSLLLNSSSLSTTINGMECCMPTCADSDTAREGRQPWPCSPGYQLLNTTSVNLSGNSTNATYIAPSQDVCCKYVPTCGHPTANSTASYQCTPPLVFDSIKVAEQPPSDSACCKATCGDTQPQTNGTQRFQCPNGYDYNMAADNNTDVSNTTCCIYVPTCGQLAAGSNTTYLCTAPLVFDASKANGKQPSDAACCKGTCGDIDPQTNGTQRFQCPDGYQYNMAADNNIDISNTTCCTRTFVPTCGRPAANSTAAYQCTAPLAFDSTKVDVPSPSDAACCKPTCGDTNTTAPGTQQFQCPDGYKFKPAAENNTDVSNSTCCKYVPTCGQPAAGSNATYVCTAPLVFDASKANGKQPSDAACCKGTCGDIDPQANGTQRFQCPEGYQYNMAEDRNPELSNSTCCTHTFAPTCGQPDANSTAAYRCPELLVYNSSSSQAAPSDATCCIATCGDTNLTVTGPQPFSCGSGYAPAPGSELLYPPELGRCCLFTPTCGQPSSTSNSTYSCSDPLLYDDSKAGSLLPSDAVCCKPTCGDTRPDLNGTQPWQCGPGSDRIPGSDRYGPPDQLTCCIGQAPAVPSCKDTNTTEQGDQPYRCPSYAVPNPTPLPGVINDSTCCLNKTCANTNPTSSNPVPQSCPHGHVLNPNMSSASPPNASICCMPMYSCIDINPDVEGCQPWICNNTEGWYVNQSASYLPNPSNEVCCLRKTCADYDPFKPGAQRVWCPPGTVYDTAMDAYGPPDRSVCCKQLATCGDADTSTNGSQPWACVAADGWVPKPGSANMTLPSNDTCCLRQTCADTDPTTAQLDPQQCPTDMALNPAMANLGPPSVETCCVAQPTCADTRPDVHGCQPYVCNATMGLVFKANATDPNPSDNVCCLLATCKDTDPNTPGDQNQQCGAKQQYDPRKDDFSPPTRARCCKPLPTCGDVDPDTPKAQTYFCDPARGLVQKLYSSAELNPSDEVCCDVVARATCADSDTTQAGQQPWPCLSGLANAANAMASPPSDTTCCMPTCSDWDLSTPGLQPWRCPAGSTPAPGSGTLPPGDSCCVAPIPLPSPSPSPQPTPPTCVARPKQCPNPETVVPLLAAGFSVSPPSGPGPFTVTYTNNAFLKCDCTEGISWLSLATCASGSSTSSRTTTSNKATKNSGKSNSTATSKVGGTKAKTKGTVGQVATKQQSTQLSVNCAKVGNVRLGTQVQLTGVPCGAIINVVLHDGSCKKATGQQNPGGIVLQGCPAGTNTLPTGCKSSDAAGGCGGQYIYTLACSGGRVVMRQHHF